VPNVAKGEIRDEQLAKLGTQSDDRSERGSLGQMAQIIGIFARWHHKVKGLRAIITWSR